MINHKLAKIFYEMAELLEMEEAPFKPRAYEKAGRSLEALAEDAGDIYRKEGILGLLKIPAVGQGIALRIEEYVKTGKIKDYEKLKKKMPVNISELTAIEGVGPKLIKLFYKKLGIKNLKDLERAARAGKLAKLPRLGEKSQEKILKGIEFYKKPRQEFLLADIPFSAEKKDILKESDIKGDLQAHTNWTDGAQTLEELSESAAEKGYEYILVTDHTKSLAMTGGLDEEGLLKQMRAIDEINTKAQPWGQRLSLCVLKGAEVNVMKDGSLDIDDEMLEKLDITGASIHSHFHMPKKEQTERLIKAMENPHVDIIFHPTGRLMGRRPEIELNMEEIFMAVKRTGTILEINAFPERLDLKDEYIKRAREFGVKFSIGTDAHDKSHLLFMKYGVWQARRAGCEKSDIVNTMPLLKLLELFREPKTQRFF